MPAAIRLRIQQIDSLARTRTRYGAKAAQSKHEFKPGSFLVEHVLENVQIDRAVTEERDLTWVSPLYNWLAPPATDPGLTSRSRSQSAKIGCDGCYTCGRRGAQ